MWVLVVARRDAVGVHVRACSVAVIACNDLVFRIENLDLELLVVVRGASAVDMRVARYAVLLTGRCSDVCVCAIAGLKTGARARHKCAEGEVIEDFAAVSPDVCGSVFAQALIVEAVDGCDLSAFVVAADKCDAVGVSDFEAEEEEERFEAVETAIDEVA